MLNRSAIWIESTKTKVPLPLGENQFDYAAFIIQIRNHQQCTADLHSAEKTDI